MRIDFRAWNLAPGKLKQLFQDAGVKLNDGAHYGTSGIGFVPMKEEGASHLTFVTSCQDAMPPLFADLGSFLPFI